MKIRNCSIIFVLCIFMLIGCKEIKSTTFLTTTKENTTTTIEDNKSNITTSTNEVITTTKENAPTTTTQEIITTTEEIVITTEHIHEYSEWQITKNPTCIDTGIEERTCFCGEIETRSIDALGHNYSEWIIVEPTDNTNGYRYKECSRCDNVFVDPNYTIDLVSCLVYELSEDESYYIVSGMKGYNYDSVVIPDTYNDKPVKEIKNNAFYGCSSLKSVIISDGVETIGNFAFYNCSSLSLIDMSEHIESIGHFAFYNCWSLTTITIPVSTTKIGQYAFYNCFKLVEIVNKSNIELSIEQEDYGYVAYYAKNIIEEESQTKLITTDDGYILYVDGDYRELIDYISKKREVEIPNNTLYVRAYAFYNCDYITSVTFPGSVVYVGECAFCNCTSLIYITMPYSVEYLGAYAFDGCTSLETITVPNSITIIERFTFRFCTSLKTIILPDTITAIGAGAFQYCTSLESVYFPTCLTMIDEYAFNECASLMDVHILDLDAWKNVRFISSSNINYANPMTYAKNLYLDGVLITG